jgi:hypothetical protein
MENKYVCSHLQLNLQSVTERTFGFLSFASPSSQSMLDCFFSCEGIQNVNVGPVLDYSLTVHATTIRSGLSDTVCESPPTSTDLGSGIANFSAGHLLPFNRPDYLHEYSSCYGLSDEPTSTKFVGHWARNPRNLSCCMLDHTPIILSYRIHP